MVSYNGSVSICTHFRQQDGVEVPLLLPKSDLYTDMPTSKNLISELQS